MEKMNELLKKYFNGETTLTEELELKSYFLSGNINAEHELYRPLFETFEEEKCETAFEPLKKVATKQTKIKHIWIKTVSYSGMAAAIVLALWIQRPQQSENYAIIHGQRIDDPEYVQRYAEKKINDMNERIQNGLKPLKNMEAVKANIRNAREKETLKNEITESDKTGNINN